jgi:uncharacterized sulfatase
MVHDVSFRRLTLLLMLAVVPSSITVQAAAPPNIVCILADDCTFRDLGCYGGQAHTPNIDQLARQGMQFHRCFQAAPMCSPTRHNIYTGLYPVKSGAYPNHTFAKEGTQSVVHYLKSGGYRVALSGKKHIAPQSVFPFEYSGKKNNPDPVAIRRLFQESSRSGQPFCLFACSNEPHSPWNLGDASAYPPADIKLPPYLADTPVVRENFSRYLAEVTYFDSQVGQILGLLEQFQLIDNTLVMVLSEQGNSFPFAKWTCYGNGLQSAMVVRWAGKVAAGSHTDAMVEYVDILPTFLAAAGIAIPETLDGRSFLSVLDGQSDRHKSFTYGLMTTRGIINGSDLYGIRTVRDQRYRLIWNLHPEVKFTNACTQADYFRSMEDAAKNGDDHAAKVVQRYYYRPEFELYDTKSDPLEWTNIAAVHPQIVERLHTELTRWMAEQGDKGHETERDALSRQGRYKDLPTDQAVREWQRRDQRRKGAARGEQVEPKPEAKRPAR